MGVHKIEIATTIKAAPEKVWAVLSDIKKFPQWVPHVTAVEIKGKAVAGSLFTLTAKTTNHTMVTKAKVSRFEPNEALAWQHMEEILDGEPFHHVEDTQQEFTLTPSGKSTKVDYHASFVAKSFKAKLGAGILIRTKLRPEMEKALGELKALVE